MKIAITGGNSESIDNVLKLYQEKYNFKVINIDSILQEINENDNKLDTYLSCRKGSLEFNHIINNLILSEINNNDNIVICSRFLETFDVFSDCDIKIKVSMIDNDLDSNYEIYKCYRQSCIESESSDLYHLVLYENDNFVEKIDNYMNNLVYSNTKVTIVVPIYNTEKYLFRLVNSVMNQTYRNLEIILIDDGSTDNSLKICHFLANKDSRIKVVHQQNVGLAETRNNGINLATGEYIAFLDSDDYIDKKMIEELVKRAKETNADVCQCGFWIHMKDGFVKDVTNEQNGPKYFEGKKDLINAHSDHLISIAAWDKLYRLSSIKDIKFDKKVTKEDADYIYRLCMNEKTFAIVDKPFYHYIKRPANSITGNKISPKLFELQEWGHNAYNEILNNDLEYQDAADKVLYNSLVHIIRYYMRDYKRGVLNQGEFKNQIQSVTNDLMSLLLHAKNVKKFRKLDEVLEIVNEFIKNDVVDKELLPSMEIPCIGILWNSLNEEMMDEALKIINEYSVINDCIKVDLEDKYRQFINEIYLYGNEYVGIPVLKAGILIDRYDTNEILILNMIMNVSSYIYYNDAKGFLYSEISELKSYIRKYFKQKIRDYAYDNIFHLTVNQEEYEYTDQVCKKYIKDYKDYNNQRGSRDE